MQTYGLGCWKASCFGLAGAVFLVGVGPFERAHAKPVVVERVTASSTEEGVKGFSPGNLVDGRVRTQWAEGGPGNGMGTSFTLHFEHPSRLGKVRFWSGDWRTPEHHAASSRPRELVLKFDDGSSQTVRLPAEQQVVDVPLDPFVQTRSMEVVIVAVEDGDVYSRTVLSEVRAFDLTADTRVPVRTPSEDPRSRLDDGMLDSTWCAPAAGAVSLRFDFGIRQGVRKFVLANGHGRSPLAFIGSGRAEHVTLTFDDGSSQKLVVPPQRHPHEFALPPVYTRYVDVAFDPVRPGEAVDGLCVAEAYFVHE